MAETKNQFLATTTMNFEIKTQKYVGFSFSAGYFIASLVDISCKNVK